MVELTAIGKLQNFTTRSGNNGKQWGSGAISYRARNSKGDWETSFLNFTTNEFHTAFVSKLKAGKEGDILMIRGVPTINEYTTKDGDHKTSLKVSVQSVQVVAFGTPYTPQVADAKIEEDEDDLDLSPFESNSR